MYIYIYIYVYIYTYVSPSPCLTWCSLTTMSSITPGKKKN